jgi:hypothetical protein
MPDYIVNLLVQVPLVGIFIWYNLQQQKIFQESQMARDKEWREFLSEQRISFSAGLSRIAEEVKNSSTKLSEVGTLMVLHDQRVQAAIPGMQAAIDREKSKSLPRK